MLTSEPQQTLRLRIESGICAAGWTPLARAIEDDRAIDIAIIRDNQIVVIRSVGVAAESDYFVLRTMIAEGDFQRAILVYADKENSYLSDAIETWHIDDIGELAARLAAETAA